MSYFQETPGYIGIAIGVLLVKLVNLVRGSTLRVQNPLERPVGPILKLTRRLFRQGHPLPWTDFSESFKTPSYS